jgi:uncharacterized protein (UPF0276 family)
MLSRRFIGHGIGLRTDHYAEVLETEPAKAPDVGFFELISENFMVAGGNPRRVLRAVAERWPVVLHGVSMSLGSADPLDDDYLDALGRLVRDVEPAWISDHLCWSSLGGHTGHDLWPMPFTEEALDHLTARIAHVQERLGRQLLIENVSSYLQFRDSTMSEPEFLAALCERADCGLLLDVNNVYVSAHNHGFDADAFLAAIPVDRVGQIHLAGHTDRGTHLLDSHDQPVCDGVWDLYRKAVRRFGQVSTLVEWDDQIPPLARVLEESRRAAAVEAEVLAEVGRADAA